MLSKKAPPQNKSRRPQRPYPKADITIEDQQREQRKLLNAGKSFQGYNRQNLDIIAISFEHKCFSEAKNRDEYISKIRSKLVEWKYIPDEDPDEGGPLKLKLPPNPPAQQHAQHQQQRNFSPPQPQTINNRQNTQKANTQTQQSRKNHQRHHSGPLLTTNIKTNGSPVPSTSADNNPSSPTVQSMYRPVVFGPAISPGPTGPSQVAFPPQFPQEHQPRQSQFQVRPHERPHEQQDNSPQPAGQRPSTSYQKQHTSPPHTQQHPPHQQTSPKSQPMTHSSTTMSNSSSTSSQDGVFVNIFDPKFLANINLNDPEIRMLWVNSVWDYFCSGGQWTGYNLNSNPTSQTGSPMPAHGSALGGSGNVNGDIGTEQVNADVDMIGQLGGYLEMRGNNASRRIEGTRATRSMSASGPSNGGGGVHSDGQWMSSMDMIDVGMTNMEGVLSGEMDSGVMSPVSFEKWILQ